MLFQNGNEEVRKLLRGFHAQVFLIVPLGFVRIELGTGLLHLVKGERLDEFRQREHFPVVTGIPAQHSQHIHESFREVAVFTVTAGHFAGFRILPFQGEHRESHLVPVPFGKFPVAHGLQQQGQVGKARHGIRPAKGFIQKIMQRKRRQPFLAADYLRDFHQVVIYDIGQVVGGELIGPLPEHFVVQGVGVHFHVPADKVVHLHDAVQGHLEADGPVRGGFQQAFHFLLRQGEGVAQAAPGGGIVHEGVFRGFGFGTTGIQFLGAVEGIIGPAGHHQLFCILPINGPALALPIRGVRMLFGSGFHHFSVLVHTLVRDDAAPVQGFDDVLFGAGHETMGVRVLDADNEITAFLLGIQIIIQSRTNTAHVKRTGG